MKTAVKIFTIAVFTILATVPMHSGPVRSGSAVYLQPDGSSFDVRVRGDEWTRIRTTHDGCAIIKDNEGWWCYGIYSADGTIVRTCYIVGRPAPADILSQSRMIPYEVLSEKAARRRAEACMYNTDALEATRKANSAQTRSSSAPVLKRGLAILAQFQDVKFTYTKEDFVRLLSQKGYNGTGSAKDYYEEQFGSNWEFAFDVSGIVTLPNVLKYYGENSTSDNSDIRAAELIRDACRKADEEIDFSIYDQDGDGTVDNVYVFVAGHDEAEFTDQTDLIWSHQWYVFRGGGIRLTCDGVLIDRYACSAELSGKEHLTGIGTFCHEYMHTFGVPDFYDTDYDEDGALAAGLWKKTSLMDGGNYNNNGATPPNLNCIERKLLGLSEPVELRTGDSYTLEPIHLNGRYCILNSATEGEYYLFECRSNEGWDKYIGGNGMLVYHIDENGMEATGGRNRWTWNTVNADPSHQCADLIEADGRSDNITDVKAPYNNIKGIFYPQLDKTVITSENTPSYRFWNGLTPETSLIGISISDNIVSFRVIDSADIPIVPEVADFSFQAYPDAIFISFESASPLETTGEAVIEWRKDGTSEYKKVSLPASDDGTYSYLIDGLESGNTLYDFLIRFENSGASGISYKTQIMTKRSPAVSWPYLYLIDGGNISRTEGFVAHAVNTSKAKEAIWSLDGEILEIHDSCRIFPQHSGTLSCFITWQDGSTDTILKEITVTDKQ